jgi:hypothetical protein
MWPGRRLDSTRLARLGAGATLAIALLAGCAAPPDRGAPVAPAPTSTPVATALPTATPVPAELSAAPSATPEGLAIAALPPLTADGAVEQVVEHAALPPEARLLARSLRPTLVAEYDEAGYWTIAAGTLGQWRVNESTWQVEPADGVAELWAIQSRLDLR